MEGNHEQTPTRVPLENDMTSDSNVYTLLATSCRSLLYRYDTANYSRFFFSKCSEYEENWSGFWDRFGSIERMFL
jgi:hypothetical protein